MSSLEEEIETRKKLEKQLKANPGNPQHLKAVDDLLEDIKAARVQRPGNIKSKYAPELEGNPSLKAELDNLAKKIEAKPANRKLQRTLAGICGQ